MLKQIAPFSSSSSCCEGRLPPFGQARPHWLLGRLTCRVNLRNPSLRHQLVHHMQPNSRRPHAQSPTRQTAEVGGHGVHTRCVGDSQCGVLVARTAQHPGSASGNQRPPARRRRRNVPCGAGQRGVVTLGLWGLGYRGSLCVVPFLDRLMAFLMDRPSPLGCMWRRRGSLWV